LVKKLQKDTKIKDIKIYVEGGGDTHELRRQFRSGMSEFLKKLKLDIMPAIVACGGREQTFDRFSTAIKQGKNAFLLVDSEEAVAREYQGKPWQHLKKRDNWDQPVGTTDEQCHLMVQCMESWFLADKDAVANYFGQGFNEKHFPPQGQNVEVIAKDQVDEKLANATRTCQKGPYNKGKHSFAILGLIDPDQVKLASPWAKRFFDMLNHDCHF